MVVFVTTIALPTRPWLSLPRLMLAAFVGLVMMGTGDVMAEELEGRVVAVADGDTLTILDNSNTQIKIRLAGIDAPEKSQAFGKKSKESLSDLVFGKTVKVETNKRDRYGRAVGKVLVENQDVNLEQIRRGLAWHYKAYSKEQSNDDVTAYGDAEKAVRSSGIGLWAEGRPVAPWDYRQRKKTLDADE